MIGMMTIICGAETPAACTSTRERTMTALTLQLLMMRLLSCIFIHSGNGMSGIGYIVETSDCVNGCFLFLCFI